MKEFSAQSREQLLAELQSASKPVPCFIIGGGIVGAGLSRELSIRGIDHVLAEKSDFASGTSSKSSKLIHGGLRYLEMFDFGLVFESLSERHWLLKTHPHLVSPLEFNLPLFEKDKAPKGARTSSILGIGLWVYDALSLFRTPFFHGKHTKVQVEQLFPKIRSQGLLGSYYYADAMMLDDELVLEVVYDSYQRGHAKPVHYLEVLKVSERNSKGNFEVTIKDTLHPNAKSFVVEAKEVISAVGPWTQVFGERVQTGSVKKLKPSKGVHLIVPWSRLPIEKCLVMYAEDGRIVFAIPRKDLGTGAELVILGTTDSPEHKAPDQVWSEAGDIDYLLKVTQTYFPEAGLSKKDIVMSYAGVRPLLDSGEESEARTSREHEVWKNKAGVVFMAGGKYTTFRKISQEIADFAFPKSGSRKHNLESMRLISKPDEYAQRFSGKPIWGKFTESWVEWKIKHHAPCRLEDLVFRRMPLWMAGAQEVSKHLPVLAGIMKSRLGWSESEMKAQIKSTEDLLRSYLSL